MNRPSLLKLLLITGFGIQLGLQQGCAPEQEIVRHRIPKDRSGLEKLRQKDSPNQFPASMRPQTQSAESKRMVVAIFEKPEATWFFKISGPVEQVKNTETQWKDFLQTVTFESGEPKWTKPDDWSESGPKPMRFATLVIAETDPPIELAISSLGPNQDLLLNVNRWRGQIGLTPSTKDELESQISKLESDEEKYLLFDAQGGGSGKMTPPMARREPVSKLDYETPAGWTAGKTSSMVPVRLTKKDDNAEVQITVVEMPADANEWAPNVKRWAEQVGLDGLTADQIAERTKDLIIDDAKGQIINLIDLESESKLGTIAGMLKRDGSAWFLKLSGDKKMADLGSKDFEAFSKLSEIQINRFATVNDRSLRELETRLNDKANKHGH